MTVKRIDFPMRPHLLKYMQATLHLRYVEQGALREVDFVLSNSNKQFGLPLSHLLRKPVKSARHEGSNEDCTALLGVDLKNYPFSYYELAQNRLTPFAIFQYNEYVEDIFRRELHWWVKQQRERGATMKDAIISYMELYEVTESELPYETLRKDVQRNGNGRPAKKIAKKGAKTDNFSMNLSPKTSGLSPKKRKVSRKIGVLSQRATWAAVSQELSKLPLPIFESRFFHPHAA